jgi:aryl-alcohol dehydrogenase-like predicted oxidoreductase
MSRLAGSATPEGTARYKDRLRDRVTPSHFRTSNNLNLTSLGIGTYLGSPDEATDASYTQAVIAALENGINVVDSAANYRFQRSERAIGKALRILNDQRGINRDEIVLCTKGGYIPFDGAPPRDVRRYLQETFVTPGIATFDDFVGGSHCMTPGYLQNQIDQSLNNLDVDCIDVYYVHNPESQLGIVSADEFYARLRAAFELLETNVAAGKIGTYGVATWNGFRVHDDAREHHSLPRMVEIARSIGGMSHGFRFIQLPYNLAMAEAFQLENQRIESHELTVLEAAAELGVTVVASASLLQGKVARGLPDNVRQLFARVSTDAQRAIQFVRSTPGITTALVGMSRPEHVSENIEVASVAPLTAEEFRSVFG